MIKCFEENLFHKCIHVISLKKSVKVRSVECGVEGAKMAVVFGCSRSETFSGPGNNDSLG
jgi:hypothetical protein